VVGILVLHSLFLTQQIISFFIHKYNTVNSENFIIRKFKDAKMELPKVLSIITWNSRVRPAVSALDKERLTLSFKFSWHITFAVFLGNIQCVSPNSTDSFIHHLG